MIREEIGAGMLCSFIDVALIAKLVDFVFFFNEKKMWNSFLLAHR